MTRNINLFKLFYFCIIFIFLNVVDLQFCGWYVHSLSLLPLLCNRRNLILYTSEKIATLMKSDFL